ncbi:hypothetical protein Tco_1313774 [Tanacetum coccineum]
MDAEKSNIYYANYIVELRVMSLGKVIGFCDFASVALSPGKIEGPMKDQPLSVDASPTALSPGYIADSDPEEDKKDTEEDPADHPADG